MDKAFDELDAEKSGLLSRQKVLEILTDFYDSADVEVRRQLNFPRSCKISFVYFCFHMCSDYSCMCVRACVRARVRVEGYCVCTCVCVVCVCCTIAYNYVCSLGTSAGITGP